MRLGIRRVLEAVCQTWIAENAPYLISLAINSKSTLFEVVEGILMLPRSNLWVALTQQFMVPELRDELMTAYPRRPGNVDTFWSGAGLGKFLSIISVEYSEPLIRHGKFLLPLLCSTAILSPTRLLRMWVRSVALHYYHTDLPKVQQVISLIEGGISASTRNGELSMTSFVGVYLSASEKFARLPEFSSDIFKVSAVGAEVWTQSSNLPELHNNSRFLAKGLTEHQDALIKVLEAIPYPLEVNIHMETTAYIHEYVLPNVHVERRPVCFSVGVRGSVRNNVFTEVDLTGVLTT